MTSNYTILEQSHTSIVFAFSDTSIGKVVLPNTMQFVNQKGEPVDFLNDHKPSIEDEIRTLKYANNINGLMPKFIDLGEWQANPDSEVYPMIIMERLYPLPLNHFDLDTKKQMIEDFGVQLKELHDNLFVHGDFMRPTNFFTRGDHDWMFRNIMQTATGLRLIDSGFAKIYHQDNKELFCSTLLRERSEQTYFKKYYLSL